jgi:hypothetical protein
VLLLCYSIEVYLREESHCKGIHRRPFQVGGLVGRCSRWVMCQSARYDRCIGYVSVTVYVQALSFDGGIPGFGCPGVVFLFIEFPLR